MRNKEEDEDDFKKSMQDSAQLDQVSAGLRQSAPVLWNFFSLLIKEGFELIFDWLNLPECELSECDECGVINLVPLSCL